MIEFKLKKKKTAAFIYRDGEYIRQRLEGLNF